MSIYMGEGGSLQIKRASNNDDLLRSDLDPEDVNADRRRFSFDFPAEALISGDRIEIYTADGSNLELVDGHDYPDGLWHCHVDDTGGVRLYSEFSEAVSGGFDNALELVKPSATQQILVRSRNSRFRCLAQMQEWELTTSRQQVDTTVLGEEFVSQFSRGLISGQGSTSCMWDYKYEMCDPFGCSDEVEKSHYLCELLLRLKQGAAFHGRFFIHVGDPSVWYEADAIVTNAALSFAPGQIVKSQIQFVTTGPVELHTGQADGLMLQEDNDLVLQESNDGILLDNDD